MHYSIDLVTFQLAKSAFHLYMVAVVATQIILYLCKPVNPHAKENKFT